MASNIKTYWSGYQGFEQTTLSESDYRVRTLLNLDYSHQREQNTIRLSIKQMEDTAYFLLRTHEEKIVAIKGGTFQKLEPDAYLINAQSPEVELVLESLSLKEQGEK